MNTIARIGKKALETLFLKMNVFGEIKISIEKRSVELPKNPEKREIILSRDALEMEMPGYRDYHGKIRGSHRSEYRCKIFTWSVTLGLVEIPSELVKKENTLFFMISKTHLQIKHNLEQDLPRSPTHIIITKNHKLIKYDDREGPTFGNTLEQNEHETISIHSVDQVWQRMIDQLIQTEEYRMRKARK